MSIDAERVLDVLRAWGTHATSFQILEPGYRYWLDETVQAPGALIAWVPSGRTRVCAGVPIAPPDRIAEVAGRFVAESSRAGDSVVFFSADDTFLAALRALPEPLDFDAVPIGEQPEWDPRDWTTRGRSRRSVRSQSARARNKGVRVRVVVPREVEKHAGALRAEIELVMARWMASRRMSPMGFLVDLQPFGFARERRYYVAEQGDRAVGFLAAIPVYRRRGWFFEDLIRVPDAPNGTAELLVDTAMRDCQERGDTWVTLGLAPLAGVTAEPGPHRLLRRALVACYRHLGPLYQFRGVRDFKQRFRPDAWRTQYLVRCPGPAGVGAFHAALRAFAGGGLVAFALETAGRLLRRTSRDAWAALIGLQAALLVPWTALLAAADGARWFGGPSIQAAWVAFDSGMVVALAGLAVLLRRRHRYALPVATLLCGATLTDVVLTVVQAANLHRAVEGITLLFVAAGIFGPLLATVSLGMVATVVAPRPAHSAR